MIKYSIIIPLYNKGQKVKRSIDSVLNQSWERVFEIIVVDDGSTDDSANYVKSYNDERIRYIYKDNGGVSSARNKGLSEAKGEWILFLDADDEIKQGAIMVYQQLMEKYSQAAMLVQRQDLYSGKGLLQKLFYSIKSSYMTSSPFMSMWLHLCFPCPRNFCFKRDLCSQVGDFDTRMSFWEDYDYTLRVAKCCKRMAFSSNVGAQYNQEQTGLSGTSHPLQKEMAYYIPEILSSRKTTFWERALLYENIEQEIAWWQGHPKEIAFYRDMQRKHFAWYHNYLHWIRAQMKRHHLI